MTEKITSIEVKAAITTYDEAGKVTKQVGWGAVLFEAEIPEEFIALLNERRNRGA